MVRFSRGILCLDNIIYYYTSMISYLCYLVAVFYYLILIFFLNDS